MLFLLFFIFQSKPFYDSSIDQKKLLVTGNNDEIIKEEVSEVCSIDNLEFLEIGKGIISIGSQSFKEARKLAEIKFSANVLRKIDSGSFKGCKCLKSVVLPEGLETISREAFSITGLEVVTFPSTLKTFSAFETFIWNGNLIKFKMPKPGIFSSSKDETMLIYNKTIAFSAANGVETITIPDEIEVIGECFANQHAVHKIIFSKKGNLKEIQDGSLSGIWVSDFDFPEGLRKCYSISENAKNVYLPSTLEEIGSVLRNTMNITIAPNCSAVFIDSNGIIFNAKKNKLLLIPTDVKKIIIPKELNEIDPVVIRSSSNLQEIEVEINHSKYYSYKNGLYENRTKQLIAYPRRLTNVTIHSDCKSTGSYCFSQSYIQKISFETINFTSFGFASFEKSKLTSIEFPSTVTSLSDYCFSGCSELKSISFSSKIKSLPLSFLTNSQVVILNMSMCTNLLTFGSNCYIKNKKLTTLIFPPNLISCSSSSLKECILLNNVVVPSSVSSLGESCFESCYSLTNISFEENSNLKEISISLFENSGIERIKVPKNVIKVMQGAFSNCTNLVTIEFEEESKLSTIQKSSFVNSNKIKHIKIPKSLKNIIPQSLTELYGLKSFEISNEIYQSYEGVIYSKDGRTLVVFPGGLKEFIIKGNVTNIAESAFSGVNY